MRKVAVSAGVALASFASVASAQSNVTLYGVADVGVEFATHVPSATSSGSNAMRVSSGNMSTSRWGMRGAEDLGAGLKALFELESGISLDTGNQNGANGKLFDRVALVGLASKDFGTVTLGRQATLVYDVGLQLDPMAFAPRYSLYRNDDAIAGRADNAIKYRVKFGGVTASAFYSFARTGAGEIPGNPKVDREMSGALTYDTGNLSVGVVYDQSQGTTVGTADQTDRRVLTGATYDFGSIKAFAGYRWLNGNVSSTAPARSNLYWAGVRYSPTGPVTLSGAVYYTDDRHSGADPVMFVASADYAFSKRTDAYLNMGFTRNKNGSQLGLVGYNSRTGTPTSVVPGKNQFGAVMGLRHKF